MIRPPGNAVEGAARADDTPPMKTAAEFDRQRYLNLVTFRMNGREVATPIWFAAAGGHLWVFTNGNSGKVKRLRRSSRARIAPCDARGATRGPWLDVRATLVTDPDAIALARAALRAKYGWPVRMLDLMSRLTGRVHQRAWIAIDDESRTGRRPWPSL